MTNLQTINPDDLHGVIAGTVTTEGRDNRTIRYELQLQNGVDYHQVVDQLRNRTNSFSDLKSVQKPNPQSPKLVVRFSH